jgi:hypothetical protein
MTFKKRSADGKVLETPVTYDDKKKSSDKAKETNKKK